MSKAERLRDHFDFTEEDLIENSKGRITEDQISLIKIGIRNEMARYLGIFLLVAFVFALFWNKSADVSAKMGDPVGIAILLLVGISFAVFRYSKRNVLSLQSMEGKVNFIWVRISGSGGSFSSKNTLKLRVNGQSFNVCEELEGILDNGDICRFYYTGGGDIVSAEYLGRAEN